MLEKWSNPMARQAVETELIGLLGAAEVGALAA